MFIEINIMGELTPLPICTCTFSIKEFPFTYISMMLLMTVRSIFFKIIVVTKCNYYGGGGDGGDWNGTFCLEGSPCKKERLAMGTLTEGLDSLMVILLDWGLQSSGKPTAGPLNMFGIVNSVEFILSELIMS